MRAMPHRPALAYRVGITGARDLTGAGATVAQIEAAVGALLDAVGAAVAACAQTAQARRVYDQGVAGGTVARLRLISPLAEGADRLVARLALARGWELECALPFEQAEYETDFPDSVAEFRDLLAQAQPRVLRLDGVQADAQDAAYARAHAYRAVGRTIVRHCDLVLALWDGAAARGPGGTAEVIGFAADYGPKVWWIDLRAPQRQVLIDNAIELRWATRPRDPAPGAAPPEEAAALAALDAYIRATLLPPPPPEHRPHGLIAPILHRLQHRHRPPPAPLEQFLAARQPPASRAALFFRRFFIPLVGGAPEQRGSGLGAQAWGKLRDTLARAGKGLRDVLLPPPVSARPAADSLGAAQDYWTGAKAATDDLANAAADRYRSSYVGVFTFAAASVSFGALAEMSERGLLFGGLEFLMLLGILLLVGMNHVGGWQERWIGCRVLAEYCRIQRDLAPLGWSIVGGQLAVPVAAGEREPPRDAWIGWYFHALLRAAPMHSGAIDAALKQSALDQVVALARGQSRYHQGRHATHERASRRLAGAGESFFIATTLLVALKLGHAALGEAQAAGGHSASLIAALCTFLPAISAALVGVRAYAEFDMLAWQSRRMRHAMELGLRRMALIQIDRALSSQDIGAEMSRLAVVMLEDTAGWAQLFGGKAVEAG